MSRKFLLEHWFLCIMGFKWSFVTFLCPILHCGDTPFSFSYWIQSCCSFIFSSIKWTLSNHRYTTRQSVRLILFSIFTLSCWRLQQLTYITGFHFLRANNARISKEACLSNGSNIVPYTFTTLWLLLPLHSGLSFLLLFS